MSDFLKGEITSTCGIPIESNIDIDTILEAAKKIGDPPPIVRIQVNKYLPAGTIIVSPDVFAQMVKKN